MRKRDRLRATLKRFFTTRTPIDSTPISALHEPVKMTANLSRTPTNHPDRGISDDPLARVCLVQDPRIKITSPLVKVGQGRTGAVFTTILDGTVMAVKEMQVPLKWKLKRRLLSEVGALSELQSLFPLVIQLHTAYLFQQGADRKLWLLMEWAENGPLTTTITQVRLTEPQMSVVMRQLLTALDRIHRKGWLHRDIKSDNILIVKTGECRLADFGAAQRIQDQPDDNQGVGTPHWTAPEVLLNGKWSEKADVWSAGCVLVEMVNGEPPLWNLSQEQLLQLNKDELRNHFGQQFVRKGSPILIDLVNQLLHIDPTKRPSPSEALCHPFITTYNHLTPRTILSAVEKSRRLRQ